MKPISFSFGIGSRNEATQSLNRQPKMKVEDSEKLTTETSKGKPETTKREKLKTKEPNAHLQKPDFSNGTKSVDAKSALQKGEVRVKQPAEHQGSEKLAAADSVQSMSADLVPDAATLAMGMGTQSLGELASKLNLNTNVASVAGPLNVDSVVTDEGNLQVLVSDLVSQNSEVVHSNASNAGTKATANDSTGEKPKIDPKFVGASTDSKTFAAISQSMSADLVDPKLMQAFAQANSADLVDPDLIQAFAQANSADLVDPKLMQILSQANAADLVDPKLLQAMQQGSAADLVDPKVMQQFAAANSADLVDPKLQLANSQSSAADIYGPPADLYYPSADVFMPSSDSAPTIKWNPNSAADLVNPKLLQQLSADLATLNQISGQSLASDAIDPKSLQNLAQSAVQNIASQGGLAADVVDPKLMAQNSAALASDLFTAADMAAPNVKALASDQAQPAPSNPLAADVVTDKDQAVFAVSQAADLWAPNADVLDPKSKKVDADVAPSPLAVDSSIGSKPAVSAMPKDVPALDRVQVGNILKQVVDRLEALAAAKPRNGVTIHLKPFDLGQITMTIKGSGKSIEAEIQVSNESVKQALEQTQKHLSASLEARGFSLANITISESASTNAQTTHSDAQSQLAQQQGQSQKASTGPRFDSSNGAVETANRRGFATSADGVDYWI